MESHLRRAVFRVPQPLWAWALPEQRHYEIAARKPGTHEETQILDNF
jgi:hypothetical protein